MSVVSIFLCRELVANWSRSFSTCFKILWELIRQNISQDCRATVVRRSCECRKLVAAKLWRIYNAKFSQHSYECRASVARRSRDSLAKTSRLSGEKKKLKLVSHWHTNFSRLFCEFCRGLSHDNRASVVRIFLCRELVANWSRSFSTC